MNSFLIVGSVANDPQMRQTAGGVNYLPLQVEVKRDFRNSSGRYDSEIFQVMLWKTMAEEYADKIRKNSFVSVKGRLQANNYTRDGDTSYRADLVGERLECLDTL